MTASKTMMKRIEQYNDRWSSHGLNTGIRLISEKLSAERLRRYDIFKPYSDKFLEKISPDVSLALWKEGALLFEEGAYLDLAFFIVRGSVDISLQAAGGDVASVPIFDSGKLMAFPEQGLDGAGTTVLDLASMSKTMASQRGGKEIAFLATMDFNLPRQSGARLGPGEFFGEIGALSGWPQSTTARAATECELIQIRLPALRLMKNKTPDLKNRLDRLYRERSLFSQLKSTPLFHGCDDASLHDLTEKAELISLEPGETLTREGEPADALYLVRSGFVKLQSRFGEGELTFSYLSKGMTLGETELMIEGQQNWRATAVSVEYAELVKIPRETALAAASHTADMEKQLWRSAADRIKEAARAKRDLGVSEFTQVALDRGLVQGSSILAIDLDVCTRCDDCVRACAATHHGRPRFVREGGKVGAMLLAKSCYHCRDPVCLVGCPTGAIHRAGATEVVKIDGEICIGCSTCANNCPYDAIVMHDMGETWPEDMVPVGLRGLARAQASKCDLCVQPGHSPACVSNCPQGCATRVGDIDSFRDLLAGEAGAAKTAKRRAGRSWLWGFLAAALALLTVFAAAALFADVALRASLRLAYGIAAAGSLAVVALYAARRRCMRLASKLRLGRTQTWLRVHLYGGSIFLLLMLMHTGFRLPSGQLNGWLWALSLWTVASGLIGLGLQRWVPRVLASGLGLEAIYERIPELVDAARAKAEQAAASAGEAVRHFYAAQLAPRMAAPERRWIFWLDITGGVQRFGKEFDYLRGFLPAEEKDHLDELARHYRHKLELDAHFTLQPALRWWLWLHAPPALLLIALAALHIFSVVYY